MWPEATASLMRRKAGLFKHSLSEFQMMHNRHASLWVASPESIPEVSWTAATHSAGERWITRVCLSLTGTWQRAAQGNILQDAKKPFIALVAVTCVGQIIPGMPRTGTVVPSEPSDQNLP